ncbi:MAG: hypothetical protein ACI4VF_06525 [Lachnospirales bacterium]
MADVIYNPHGVGQPLSEAYKELDKRVDEILKTTGTILSLFMIIV